MSERHTATLWIKGKTLRDMISSHEAVPPFEAAKLIREAAKGLAAAHKRRSPKLHGAPINFCSRTTRPDRHVQPKPLKPPLPAALPHLHSAPFFQRLAANPRTALCHKRLLPPAPLANYKLRRRKRLRP